MLCLGRGGKLHLIAQAAEIVLEVVDAPGGVGVGVLLPKFPKPSATFERCEEIIRNVHALTGGAPQLVHLWGWQFRGKDTRYPAVNVVDERIGGYDGMMRLRQQVKPLK